MTIKSEDEDNSNTSIEISDVGVRYSNGLIAIHNINLHLKSGRIYALIGMNGSGKSTLFKSILGLEKTFSGYIKICNSSVNKSSKLNLISYVQQSEDVDWSFPISVFEVILQGRFNYMGFFKRPKQIDKDEVLKYAKLLSISHLLDRQIGELSGGQRKRVFVARALTQQSKIILLDEPFTGVDSKTEEDLMKLFIDLKNKGYLILISTHNLNRIMDFCTHGILLNKTIVEYGDINKIFTREKLQNTFDTNNLNVINLAG